MHETELRTGDQHMTKTIFAVAILSALLPTLSQAQEGPHSVYVGGSSIQVNATMPDIAGPGAPPGARLRIGSANTVGFGYAYRINPQLSVELALGLPPTHKVYGDGVLAPFGQVAAVEQMPPTVFLNYHTPTLWKLQPLVGLGLNYTRFSKTASTPSGDAAAGGPNRISLSSSTGLAWHAGFTVPLYDKVSLVATVAGADVKSRLTNTTAHLNAATTQSSTDITFRPTIYTLALGYSF
jgi:outer membrane protein